MNICKLSHNAALARNVTLALGVAAAGGSFLACSAHATAILSFGQSGNGNTVVGTQTGTSTTIVAANAPITISQIDAANITPLAGFLDMNFQSTSVATSTLGSLEEHFTGSFSMTSGANGSGTNFLSGTLIDIAFGSNAAFNLNASTPPSGNVTFTSDVISASDLGLDRGAGFSFANVFPLLGIEDGTFTSFTSSASGTFSANTLSSPPPPPPPVMEPASLALFGAGLLGLGVIHRRRRASATRAQSVVC
jgi:hypothetical protein